ncbi:MAG: hypothetical protein R3C11_28270 [Planctomycetaceae bacterium]
MACVVSPVWMAMMPPRTRPRLISSWKREWRYNRLRVRSKNIKAWLNEERIVNAHTEGRKYQFVRLPSKPFGIATWQTTGAIRNVRIRELTKAEIEEAK